MVCVEDFPLCVPPHPQPVLIVSLSFPTLFFGGLCLYFILVHPFLFFFLFLAFLIVFVPIFSGWSCLFGFPLSPLCGCLFCLCLFFHHELSLSSFLICLFAGVFCFTWGSSPLHIDVNVHWLLILDFAEERRGEGVGKPFLWGLEKGYWDVEAVSYLAIHILQTYTSVSGQKSDAFSLQVFRIFEICPDFTPFVFSVSLPGCSRAQLSPLQLPAVLLSLKHVLPITISLQHFTYMEHPLGRGVVFEEEEVIIDNESKSCIAPILIQGQKQDSRNSWPCSIGHRF